MATHPGASCSQSDILAGHGCRGAKMSYVRSILVTQVPMPCDTPYGLCHEGRQREAF